jgi:hypothetical protein
LPPLLLGLLRVGCHPICHPADGLNMRGKILFQVRRQEPGLIFHGTVDLVVILFPEPRIKASTYHDKNQQNPNG